MEKSRCLNNDDIMVSVILVSYNEEKYIKEALDSIVRQKTTFKFEIICHDDASTDKTSQYIREYYEKYPDIIVPVIQSDNKMQKGHQIVTEFCYPLVRGKYISYCDGDDYWDDENKLQKEVDFLEEHEEYSMCLHNFDFLYSNNERHSSFCGVEDKDFSIADFILWEYDKIPQLGTSVFRSAHAINRPELFVKIGGGKNSKRPISDQPLYIYMALNGKVHYFHDVMSVWRRHENTWANDGNVDKEIQFNKDKIQFFSSLKEQYPQVPKESLEYAIGKCKYSIAWLSEDYYTAGKNIKYADVRLKTKAFIIMAKIFPQIAHKIRVRKK